MFLFGAAVLEKSVYKSLATATTGGESDGLYGGEIFEIF
jgi:hypothetical protein